MSKKTTNREKPPQLTTTYDSLRTELFDKQPPGFFVDQKRKVDSILRNRYFLSGNGHV